MQSKIDVFMQRFDVAANVAGIILVLDDLHNASY